MDTLKEKNMLEEMWESETVPCPWKIWGPAAASTS